jgi:hypothetical protein
LPTTVILISLNSVPTAIQNPRTPIFPPVVGQIYYYYYLWRHNQFPPNPFILWVIVVVVLH